MADTSMFFRFLLVGGSGFLIDASLTYLLIIFDVPPWLARIPAISLAMLFTWIANRHFTYQVITKRSTMEALRYATIAAGMALVNYIIFYILVDRGIWPVAAVTVATTLQSILSFYLYRNLVFR